MALHSSTLAGKSHGQRSLVGCSSWGRQESDTSERIDFHLSPSCIGEGNGNPLQYSCLENPQGQRSLVGCRLWGHTDSDTTEATQQQQQHKQPCAVCTGFFQFSIQKIHWFLIRQHLLKPKRSRLHQKFCLTACGLQEKMRRYSVITWQESIA